MKRPEPVGVLEGGPTMHRRRSEEEDPGPARACGSPIRGFATFRWGAAVCPSSFVVAEGSIGTAAASSDSRERCWLDCRSPRSCPWQVTLRLAQTRSATITRTSFKLVHRPLSVSYSLPTPCQISIVGAGQVSKAVRVVSNRYRCQHFGPALVYHRHRVILGVGDI